MKINISRIIPWRCPSCVGLFLQKEQVHDCNAVKRKRLVSGYVRRGIFIGVLVCTIISMGVVIYLQGTLIKSYSETIAVNKAYFENLQTVTKTVLDNWTDIRRYGR